MRSKIAKRILDETPQEVKDKVQDYANKLILYNVTNSLNERHPKCLGDGIDDCGYNTKISCDECKFNNSPFGKKDPNAKCNQY